MGLIFLSLIVLVAFVPSLIYMIVIRNTERYEREPWRYVFKSFLWGATFGIILAAILELIIFYFYSSSFSYFREYEFLAKNKNKIDAIILAVIIAPFVEEATKAYGVLTSKKEINEIEDGMVYGSSSGFGFAATENLLYEISALASGGIISWLAVATIRSFASALLHGSATAMTGFGYSSRKMIGRGSMAGGYLIAVAMHSSFNIIASVPIILSGINPILYTIPLLIAIIYGVSAFKYIRGKIRYYDKYPRR